MPATYLGCQMAQPRLGGQEPCPVAFSTAFESTVSFYTFTCFLRCICFGVGVCLSIPISISRDDVSRGSPWFSHTSFPPTRLFGTRVGSSDSESLHRLRSRIETCARTSTWAWFSRPQLVQHSFLWPWGPHPRALSMLWIPPLSSRASRSSPHLKKPANAIVFLPSRASKHVDGVVRCRKCRWKAAPEPHEPHRSVPSILPEEMAMNESRSFERRSQDPTGEEAIERVDEMANDVSAVLAWRNFDTSRMRTRVVRGWKGT